MCRVALCVRCVALLGVASCVVTMMCVVLCCVVLRYVLVCCEEGQGDITWTGFYLFPDVRRGAVLTRKLRKQYIEQTGDQK